MEMQPYMDLSTLQILKQCLDKNFYGFVVTQESTEISVINNNNEVLLKKFAVEKSITGLSQKSIQQYVFATRKFLDTIGKNYLDITSDDINIYLYGEMKRNVSKTGVENTRKFIKAFFTWLYENELIQKDIFKNIKNIKKEDKPKQFLTEEEVVLMRDNCQTKRELALIDFLYSTGVRVSECANLKIEDVDFMDGCVKIYGQKTRKWRRIYLNAQALKHLNDYINEKNIKSEYVFAVQNGKKTTCQTIEKIVKTIADRSGIKKKCTVHLFRKTLATRMKRMGVGVEVIAEILGHSSSATTEKYYMSISDEQIKRACLTL